MISVDDNIDSKLLPLIFGYVRKSGGDDHQRYFPGKRSIGLAEFKDLIPGRLLTVNHDAVGACLELGAGSSKSVVQSLFEDQALDARDDHEIVGDLRSLALFDKDFRFATFACVFALAIFWLRWRHGL